MQANAILERSPMRLFTECLHGGLKAGELGAVVGRAGVGKSAMLVHIALDRILNDKKVIHVSLSAGADHVRSFYDEIFTGVARAARQKGRETLALQVERSRLIHSYLGRSFTADDLTRVLELDRDVMHFTPDVVLLDGVPDQDVEATLEGLAGVARAQGFALWVAGRTHRDEGGDFALQDRFSTVVSLTAQDDTIAVKASKVHGEAGDELGLNLDPVTMLVVGEDEWDPASAPWSPRAQDCVLYSGGATGAESAFGEAAERWGLREVNFTFTGHKQNRDRGSHQLTDQELTAGDVSLVYVSRRLNRTFNQGKMIKRVLQSIWHQVSRAQQVFVIGTIQDDDTVTGGTGWAVELARMWHKDLWVFDQERNGWFHWEGDAWRTGTPVVEAPDFCGTGTRYLRDSSTAAIEQLFQRSFDR